ncbi:hypothetical protein H6P81_007622 [Aristolochia fimbriata]|uniref:Kinesin-like protein n=1 Tax=Aristolochia fimbriata TaxID=158543 RepID=A0AAV7F101_ARIFI|nr:hypothetical protein H6P81_007622 [Aristolochia fimbriata]
MSTSVGLKTPKSANCAASSRHPRSDSATRVRVVVRIRPFLASEIVSTEEEPTPCISLIDTEAGSVDEVAVRIKDQETSRNECYELDSFYGQESNLSQIFHTEVFPVIPGIFQGCNATVFAYGATGSGKTFTMQGTDEQPGLMPLAMSTVLSLSESMGCSAEISYFEIYMDRCYDLLEPKAKEISVLDSKDGCILLKGLSQVPVRSMSEFYEIFSCGVQRRKVAHTGLNDVSSRSHGVLMIAVASHDEESDSIISGKLNLIDLAGNEDNRRTCNEGVRLQESATINQSLFALSNVIYALNNNKSYVPYRDSKLTRILQDSLGGTSRSLMIACLNPISYQEAVHTVCLAARSRQIVNFVSSAQKQEIRKEKVDMEAKLRAWLESKGKTKSIRQNGLCSPYQGRANTPKSSLKKPNLNSSSVKEKKIPKHGVSCSKERKPLTSSRLITSTDEESYTSNAVTTRAISHSDKESFPPEEEDHKNLDRTDAGGSCLFTNESCENQGKDIKLSKHNVDQEEDEKVLVSDSKACVPEVAWGKENICTPTQEFVGFPSINERIKALKNSIRSVFSPIDSNIKTPPGESPSDDQFCVVMFKQRSPKTPLILTGDNASLMSATTPLDRFKSCASDLKSSLIQEYLTFLNTASKEDLLRLKGIGQKRADYIMELRENSPCPIKSLSDLEKIGLSTKQVHDMFRKAAREIFS